MRPPTSCSRRRCGVKHLVRLTNPQHLPPISIKWRRFECWRLQPSMIESAPRQRMLKRSTIQRPLRNRAHRLFWLLFIDRGLGDAESTNTLNFFTGLRFRRLELAFKTIRLRTICESKSEATRELGAKVARVLTHRLADLRAARSPVEIVVGHPRELGANGEHMAVDLVGDYRIVFCANHPKRRSDNSGIVDWSRVSRIKILRIGSGDA